MYKYRAYGLKIHADIPLPALQECDEAVADIRIEAAAINPLSSGATRFRNWEADPDRFLSHYSGLGRVLVTSGTAIHYDRENGLDDRQLISVLLGTGLAAAMMQRRMLPMHACAVMCGNEAVLVMGRSGAGKSTMLGGMLHLGLTMLADDVTAIKISDDGRPLAIPAFPAIRLWEDSLESLGESSDNLPRVRADLAKYYLPIAKFHDRSVPIRAVVHLQSETKAALNIASVDIAQRVARFSDNIFRKNFIDGMGLRRFAFECAAKTVGQIQLIEAYRPDAGIEPKLFASKVLAFLDQTEAEAGHSFNAA